MERVSAIPITSEVTARGLIPARLRDSLRRLLPNRQVDTNSDALRIREIEGSLHALQRPAESVSRRRENQVILPPVVLPPRKRERPEPSVVKRRITDLYPWLFLGNPKKVAESVAANPGAPWNAKRITNAVREELEGVHLSDSRLFFNRILQRGWNFVKTQATHAIVKGLVAAPEAIPFFGQLVAAGIATYQGKPNEIKLHLLGMLPFDTVGAIVITGAAALGGPFLAIPAAIPFVVTDFIVNASARKHAREVNNLLIPALARTMSYEKSPRTPQANSKRAAISRNIAQIYATREGKRWFDELSKEERDLDPLNGLTRRKRRDYQIRDEEVHALSDAVEVYRSLLDPRISLSRPELVTQFEELIRKGRLLDKKTGLLKRRKRKMIARDLARLRYFHDKYEEEKNATYDHPYLEARRLREIWNIATDFQPQMKVNTVARRR